MLKKSRILFVFLIFFPLNCLAADVIINEICWMGTKNSGYDEWIEFYNNTNSDIDLSGWKLIDQDGKPKIELFGKIPAQGFFILERTDDTTVPDIQADIIYTGALDNKGGHLQLIDKQEKIIDEIDCANEWFAGDNETKQTMEKIGDNWQTSENPGGTPRAPNSPGVTTVPTLEVGEIKLLSNEEPDRIEVGPLPQAQHEVRPQNDDFIAILLTGLPISFISSASILVFRKKLSHRQQARSI